MMVWNSEALVVRPMPLKMSGRVIEHHVDADELLEDRQHDADENDQRAEGKQFAGVMLTQRGADFGDFLFAFLRRYQPAPAPRARRSRCPFSIRQRGVSGTKNRRIRKRAAGMAPERNM